MIAARQTFLGRGGAKLPYDAEVEYLESTGTQYIDTGIALSNASLADITWVVEVTNFNDGCIGVYGQSQLSSMYVNFYANKFYMRNMRQNGGNFAGVSGFNTIRFSGGTSYLNGTAVETDIPLNTNPTYSMFLFAYNRSGVVRGFCKARVSSFTVKVSDVLIADFIPVRVGSEGAMYDRVSKQLFRNQGTGAFLYGRDINPISARSYVNDGLIAMWDGIENAGWGVHDANAATWKDLTGNHVLSYEFTPSFTDNAFELPGTDKVSYCESNLWRDAVNSNQCTVEICFKGYSVGGNNSIIALSIGTSSNVERAWWQWGNVGFGYRISTGSTWSNNTLLPRGETDDVSLSFPLADMYINGTKVMTGSPGTLNIQSNTLVIGRIGAYKSTINGFVTMRADIHSIRIYNKVFTAAEIAANYAVDKARFNLP